MWAEDPVGRRGKELKRVICKITQAKVQMTRPHVKNWTLVYPLVDPGGIQVYT